MHLAFNDALDVCWNTTIPISARLVEYRRLDSGEDTRDRGRGTIVAVDLLHMQPIPNVKFVQADYLADCGGDARAAEAHKDIVSPHVVDGFRVQQQISAIYPDTGLSYSS
ncbi:hypothetical protein APHAL10511_003359 [Amanita phalloides]|nr:hypothetical protein APHAL10511_003359 [Amanita phalloides]